MTEILAQLRTRIRIAAFRRRHVLGPFRTDDGGRWVAHCRKCGRRVTVWGEGDTVTAETDTLSVPCDGTWPAREG